MPCLVRWGVALLVSTAACARDAPPATPGATDTIELPTTGFVRAPTPPKMLGVRTTVVGCWALFDRTGASAEQGLYFVPPIVQLHATTELGLPATAPGVRLARRLDAQQHALPRDPTDMPISWQADSLTDTVRLAFFTMFSGTDVLLAVPREGSVHDTLRGIAWSRYDMGPIGDTPGGAVQAVRVASRERAADLREIAFHHAAIRTIQSFPEVTQDFQCCQRRKAASVAIRKFT